MFNNYFYLRRSVTEINEVIVNSQIVDIYSQEKDILSLHIPSDEYPNRHFQISVHPQNPYILIRKNYFKARKNVIQFFEKFLPLQIIGVEIDSFDRCIKLRFINNDLVIVIRGNKSNIILIDNENKNELKFKRGELSGIYIIKEALFINKLDLSFINSIEIPTDLSLDNLKKQIPMISKEIKEEIAYRKLGDRFQNDFELLKSILNEIYYEKIKVGLDNKRGTVVFCPYTFRAFNPNESEKVFNNYNDALDYYIGFDHRRSRNHDISNQLDKYFNKEINFLEKKLSKLNDRIKSGSKEEYFSNCGNLLLSNIYKLKKGMAQIEVDNYVDGSSISIKLNPKLNPNENIDRYFEKAKDEKLNFKKSQELFKFTNKKYEALMEEYKKYQDSSSLDELNTLFEKFIGSKEKKIQMDSGEKFKYWHYLIDDHFHVYIGRDSKSNDYLSIKFAKQNDYWFHARGLPGSHVLLRMDTKKEEIPKPIIRAAASIAAFYSKAKTAGTASVSYTFAKYVHKKKGMAPGKVLLTKEKTLLVTPEIPKNAILVND